MFLLKFKKTMNKFIKLIVSILLCQLAGFIGAVFTTPAIPAWYTSLNKPNFSPPNWLFGPVWILLYTLMGISFYFIWQKKAKREMIIFLIHLAINSLWSIIFFGLKNLSLSFLVIIFLWSMIVLLIIKFSKIKKLASYLLIPYFLWISFASFLNLSIWLLNK